MAAKRKTTRKARKPKLINIDGHLLTEAMRRWPMVDLTIANDSIGERPGNRIRALMARTRPLSGNEVPGVYWEGRSLVEGLALAFDLADECYQWDAINCATVLRFLSIVEPVEGTCFCNDPSAVNATCGFHVILDFMAHEMGRTRPKAKDPKRPAEVAHD